jgi:hypothetical protein
MKTGTALPLLLFYHRSYCAYSLYNRKIYLLCRHHQFSAMLNTNVVVYEAPVFTETRQRRRTRILRGLVGWVLLQKNLMHYLNACMLPSKNKKIDTTGNLNFRSVCIAQIFVFLDLGVLVYLIILLFSLVFVFTIIQHNLKNGP